MNPPDPPNSAEAPFPHTAVHCLAAIATHHGLSASVARLLHDYALPAAEPETTLLLRMARDLGLKAKALRLTRDKLFAMGGVFPLIAHLNNGNFLVVAGVRRNEQGGDTIGIMDPLANQPGVWSIPADLFMERWNGEVILLKRVHALTDPHQPFGLAWFIPELLQQGKTFRDVAVAALTLHGIGLLTPLFFQLVIDKVLVHQSYSTLYVLGGGITIALVFEALFGFLRQYLLLAATNKVDVRIATRTFAHLLNLPITFFESVATGVTIRHMQQAEKIRQFLTGRLLITLLDASALFVFLPILLLYSVKLTLLVLLFTALIAGVIMALLGPFRRRLRNLYMAEAERQAMLVESVGGMRTVKSLALEPAQRKKWDQRVANAVTMHFQVGKIAVTANAITGLLEKWMTVAVIAFGAMDVFDQNLSVGALIAFQMISGRVTNPLVQIVALVQEYQETALSVQMLGEVMNRPPERSSGEAKLRPELQGNIAFDGVSFRYTPEGAPVLDRVSLTIPAGIMLGVVGKSGSGKSTLTKLIQGLYQPQEGIIRLDGFDLREIDLSHLRKSIGVVLQESFLFKGSVRENIAVTKPDATPEEVAAAARLAGADEFIERLPHGFDTLLEENASNLSGGQRQRLAIARALLPRPRLLILDEATSSLDPDSETIFMENLAGIAANRTVLMITHRLTTLMACQGILVLDQGRPVGVGKHTDLLNNCPQYRHLWNRHNRQA